MPRGRKLVIEPPFGLAEFRHKGCLLFNGDNFAFGFEVLNGDLAGHVQAALSQQGQCHEEVKAGANTFDRYNFHNRVVYLGTVGGSLVQATVDPGKSGKAAELEKELFRVLPTLEFA